MDFRRDQQSELHFMHMRAAVRVFLQALISVDGVLANVLKFKPPMVFSSRDGEQFLQRVEEALKELQKVRSEVAAMDVKLNAVMAPGQLLATQYFQQLTNER
jgi:hypothetical protein